MIAIVFFLYLLKPKRTTLLKSGFMFTIKLFSSAEDILNSKFERWLFLYSSIRLLSIAFSRWILYFCYDFVFVKEKIGRAHV